MAVKYQISLCLRPKDILLVTLNHMDAIRSFVCDNPTLKAGVEGVCRLLLKVHCMCIRLSSQADA